MSNLYQLRKILEPLFTVDTFLHADAFDECMEYGEIYLRYRAVLDKRSGELSLYDEDLETTYRLCRYDFATHGRENVDLQALYHSLCDDYNLYLQPAQWQEVTLYLDVEMKLDALIEDLNDFYTDICGQIHSNGVDHLVRILDCIVLDKTPSLLDILGLSACNKAQWDFDDQRIVLSDKADNDQQNQMFETLYAIYKAQLLVGVSQDDEQVPKPALRPPMLHRSFCVDHAVYRTTHLDSHFKKWEEELEEALF